MSSTNEEKNQYLHNTIYEYGSDKLIEFKKHILRLLPFWLAGSITAFVATFYAKIFSLTENISIQLFEKLGYWFILIPPIFFSISWYLVEKFARKSNGSGIPQLMASVELAFHKRYDLVEQFLNLRIIVVKIFSSLVGVVGGGAIGREGPTLQISGSIFHLFNKYWKFTEIHNSSAFLIAGAASGLASAFNTPLGGIVYVIEELAKSHFNTFRTGVLHAVIFAGIISQMIMGPYLYFGFPIVKDYELTLTFKYILVALFAALIVTLFAESLKSVVKLRAKLNSFSSKLFFAFIAGLVFALCAVFISSATLGPGKEILTHLLENQQSAKISEVISRFLGSLLTYANGGAGGIFAPTLSLGGTASSFFNSFFEIGLDNVAILIGMTAGLAALTHSPLTSFILILEMTDRHKVIFPLMLAAIIGHGLSKLLTQKSFYEFVMERLLLEFNIKHEHVASNDKHTQNEHTQKETQHES